MAYEPRYFTDVSENEIVAENNHTGLGGEQGCYTYVLCIHTLNTRT